MITGRFVVPADHPSLPGHFPGSPVIPGVVLLDEILALFPVRPAGLASAKFLSPVPPGAEVVVDADESGGQFTCRVDGAVVLRGRVMPQEA